MNDPSCIFCKIIKGEIPCSKVYEDSSVLGFLDIMPAVKGHCLVVPKEHHPDARNTPTQVLASLFDAAKKIAKSQEKALGSSGHNFLINNGADAGQVVFHTHLHVIPRHHNDGFSIKWDPGKYSEGEMKTHQEKLASFP